jgi:hypothetical protein
MERLAAGHCDPYNPGTSRERQYLNTLFTSDSDVDISELGVDIELGDPISDSEDELH